MGKFEQKFPIWVKGYEDDMEAGVRVCWKGNLKILQIGQNSTQLFVISCLKAKIRFSLYRIVDCIG